MMCRDRHSGAVSPGTRLAPTLEVTMLNRTPLILFSTLTLLIVTGADGSAQSAPADPQAGGEAATMAQTPTEEEDDPGVLDPTEPDFVLINVPTNLRLPLYRGNFRLTHRFVGNLRNGSFSEQASNLFGIDQGAIIGFEYRMAILRDVQAAVYRTNFDKTIQLYGKYDAIRQRGSMPVAISGVVSVEGADNFQERYAPAVGLVLSRRGAGRYAAYLVPMWVGNTNASLAAVHDHDGQDGDTTPHDPVERRGTFYVGVGGRARISSTVYLVAEVAPRLTGYAPDEVEYGFGIEKRVGSHAFSLTFTNSFGTTFAQLARGGTANALYLGFNLGRKFY
jgi:hypothetical protein